MITDVAHDIFRHANKAIAWIDASVRAHGKGILHAVHEGDGTPASEDASAVVVDIPDLNLVHIFQVLIQQIDQQLSVCLGRERHLSGSSLRSDGKAG